MKYRITLLTLLLGAPCVAYAQPTDGLYVSGLVGGNFMPHQNLESVQGPRGGILDLRGFNGTVGMNSGVNVRPAIGWGFGQLTPVGGPRVEVEGNYLYNRFNGTSLQGNPASGSLHFGGYEQKYGVMFNAIWDFDVGSDTFYPYIGVGVGDIWSNWKSYGTNNVNGNTNLTTDATVSSFAYQAMIGTSIPIDEVVPGLSIYTGFRFLALDGHRKYDGTFSRQALGGGTVSEPVKIKAGEDYNYSLGIGVRYRFNVPPPPPPPAPVPVAAPAPAPARTYLVFFDWDKADLTDRARQIIAEAAQNSTRVQYTRIDVAGHADRTGSAAYNMTLSRRRAETVAAELVRDGVPRTAITIQAFGDTHPLVPTAAGVREPQNRRVEIVLQ
jgi:outer membrane protein OmpA-like peptidoglycan-associated protein